MVRAMTTPPPALTRRHLLAALAATVAAPPALAEAPARSIRPAPRPAQAAAATRAAPALGNLVEAARLGGQTGVAVVDAATGQPLEGFDETRALPPASCAKAMTALFALDRLGPGHRWVTQVLATGPVQGGQVQGDLVLAGSGDPTLTSDQLGDLAAALRDRGVRGIAGRFLVHAGPLPHVPRIADDQPDHVGYNPSIAGLNLNHNRVHFEWKRAPDGWQLTMDARGQRFVPQVAMSRIRAVDREAPVFTYAGGDGVDDWTVSTRALGQGGSRWLPVRHPELYCAEVFQTLAAAQGIRLPAPRVTTAAPGGAVLAQVASDTLLPVMRDMLRYSTNLTAEVVGLSASGARSLPASGAAMGDWATARYGTGGRYVDHSGLGAQSRVAALDLAQALARARGAGLAGILREQGMRDAQGQPVKGSPVRVPAKTGTLNFVSGLAGYIQPPGGRELAFAILSADLPRRDGLRGADRESPPGGRAWLGRARTMQGQMVSRWAAMFA